MVFPKCGIIRGNANDSHLGLELVRTVCVSGENIHKHISSTVSILSIYTVVDKDSLLVSRLI